MSHHGISETGLPNGGSSTDRVDVEDAQTHNQSMMRHLLENEGTALRPGLCTSAEPWLK